MNWNSKDELIHELGLKPDGESKEEILRSIRQAEKELHPDLQPEHKFASEEEANRWHKLQAAKKFMEADRQLAVIPIEQLPALIRAFKDPTNDSVEVRSSRIIEESRTHIRADLLTPKITSAVCGAICLFFVALPSSLKDNPLASKLLSNPALQSVLLIGALYAGIFFVLCWLKEQSIAQHLAWLLTEDGKFSIAREISHTEPDKASKCSISLREVIDIIRRQGRRRMSIAMLSPFGNLDLPTAEKAAKLIIDQLKGDNILTQLPKAGFDTKFEMPAGIVQELKDSSLGRRNRTF